ncbi:sensor histidine kinase [Paenibacillus guangzhouensis]|uniref:sensor histidine kinase n=1 Tax=Paenibacillus guangzhouensis TaxID=1473112 RepID=UPI001266C44E|nr:sensor histidine kinase [Paenibacillus guangzhouensis]
MIRRYIGLIAILLVIFLMGLTSCSAKPTTPFPVAEAGILDLRGWDFDQQGTVMMKGEWEFVWHQLMEPGDFKDETQQDFIQVPGSWKFKGKDVSPQGYATYRLKILHHPMDQTLAIRIPNILTSYRMWLNGKEVASVGTVGTSIAEAIPEQMPKVVFMFGDRDLDELVIQVSNFHHRRGGIWKEFEYGVSEQVVHHQYIVTSRDMLILGIILMMGVYHFWLYFLRRQERAALYFGLVCVFIGVRMFTGECFLVQWFPWIPWEASLQLEYICLAIAPVCGMYYVSSMFPREAYPRINRVLLVVAGVLTLFVLLTKPIVFSKYIVVFQACLGFIAVVAVIIMIRAVRHRRPNAVLALGGVVIFAASTINDVFYYNEIWYTGDITHYGLLLFVIMQSMIVSKRVSQMMDELENVTSELRELNNNLETRIEGRTVELLQMNASLEQSNLELERMEDARRRLLTNISHDLRTPMTLIQGYLEALHDDIIVDPEERKKYMQLMLRKMTGLNHLISDVFELSKLESGQVPIHIKEMSALEFMDQVEQTYAFEVENRGLHFYSERQFEHVERIRGLSIQVDLERMFQVFNNLVYNAVKFTPIGGEIRMHFSYLEEEQKFCIQCMDTGIGVSKEDTVKIFERFYKNDYSRNSRGGGSGIGLSIAKEIIESHHGAIWVQSELGQGCHFYITLPATMRRRIT